jgi:hypothetical protein
MSTPDERAFRADLERAPFLLGVVESRWALHSVEGVIAIITVTAKDGRSYALRFDIAGYPQSPPTARLWDPDTNAPLATQKWPRSRAGGRLGAVFRQDWKGGTALYLPCDRCAIEGHDGWRTQVPSKIWRPAVGIVHYLEQVHELLHSADYDTPLAA